MNDNLHPPRKATPAPLKVWLAIVTLVLLALWLLSATCHGLYIALGIG